MITREYLKKDVLNAEANKIYKAITFYQGTSTQNSHKIMLMGLLFVMIATRNFIVNMDLIVTYKIWQIF